MIEEIQTEVRQGNLNPNRAAILMSKLSSLIGNCNEEIREADLEYNRRLLECLETHEKANRAKIVAETSDEYSRKRKAMNTKELTIEMIRSLKYLLKAFGEEQQVSKYQ